MSEFQVIHNPVFHNKTSNAAELYMDDTLQFAYYAIDADGMMGFTPEDEDVTMIVYVLMGSISITTPEEKVDIKEHTSLVFNNIQHTYVLVAKEFSKVLVFTNNASVQQINAANQFQKTIEDIEQKDIYTTGHSHRVRKYACAIALAIDPSYDIIPLGTAAGLHDVGKICVPQEILQKPAKLTDEEYAIIKKHPLDTYALLRKYFDEKVARTASLHHERIDGSGYPYGLEGDEIPFEARIIAVADAFDAMTSHRNYRNDLTFLQAIEELERFPKQYDCQIVSVLKQLIIEGKLEKG